MANLMSSTGNSYVEFGKDGETGKVHSLIFHSVKHPEKTVYWPLKDWDDLDRYAREQMDKEKE